MVSSGKIFQESDNIYQDEAKVLFNYYQQAAERIVQEEERIEKQIAIIQEEIAVLEKKKSTLWLWLFLLIIPYFIKKKNLLAELAEKNGRVAEFKKMHAEIFRDYKVSKLGVAYVPVADQIKYEDKSFIVDYTGQVPMAQVTLQLSRQNELLGKTIGDLEQLTTEAPIVETSNEAEPVATEDYSLSMQEINQNDYFGKLDRSLRTISYCMNDLDTTSVELPLIKDHSERLAKLNEYATNDIPADASVINVFEKDRFQNNIAKFQELNKLKDSLSTETTQFEDVLKNLMQTMANSVQVISAMKLASTDKMVDSSNRLLYRMLKSPYNHYSPLLEAEEIQRIRDEKFDYTDSVQGYTPFSLRQSSRVRYNIVTDTWVAEDGSTTSMPFGVHQIYEEIVAPMVQSLMLENRIERLKIYNHIKDQKLSYLNKWHQDTDAFYRDNRKQSADIINLMQESLREYVAAYNTLVSFQKTQNSMESAKDLSASVVKNEQNDEETIAAFETQAQQFEDVQNDFEEYIDRLKEDIDERAEKFGHVEYYDARLQDGHSNEEAIAATEVGDMDERRKSLSTVNPLLAKKSEIPPAPQIEDITYEHLSINLPVMAKVALDELDAEEIAAANAPVDDIDEVPAAPAEFSPNQEDIVENEDVDDIESEVPENEGVDNNSQSEEELDESGSEDENVEEEEEEIVEEDDDEVEEDEDDEDDEDEDEDEDDEEDDDEDEDDEDDEDDDDDEDDEDDEDKNNKD